MAGVERSEILPHRAPVACACPRVVLRDGRIKLWHRCPSAQPPHEPDALVAVVRAAALRPVQPSGVSGGYAPGGVDHSRPWAPPPRRRPAPLATGSIVAGRPSGIGIQHLFRRPGEWSLCHEAVWLEVQRAELVSSLTWICARCRELADVEHRVPLFVEWIRRRQCPRCRGPLTDPARSRGGWRHCPACRCGWGIATQPDGSLSPIRRGWSVPGQAEVAARA